MSGTHERTHMRLLASSSQQSLLIKARRELGMTQREFSDAVGSSVRTVARWEDNSSSPAPWHFEKLAALLQPVDRALAHDAALFAGKTLEALGLVQPPPRVSAPQAAASLHRPPPEPATAPPAAPALPVRVLVDAIVFAAIEALGASPATFDSARAAVRAAFAHARDLRLSAAEVAEALAPSPPTPPATEPPGPPQPEPEGRKRRKRLRSS